MKKYIFGIAAVLLAVGLSAYTSKDKLLEPQQTFYWFKVNPGYGGSYSFLNAEVTALPGNPSVIAPAEDCIGAGYNCVVGFSQAQLLPPSYTQLNNGAGGTVRRPMLSLGQPRGTP